MHRVFVGFACNNRCGFCAQGSLRERELESVVARDLAGVVDGATVAFIGGEPTLFDGLPDWVRSARARGARDVLVQTNGRRLSDPAYAELLEGAGVSRLDVSLQGATAALHDFHTSVAGSFEQTSEGIRCARAGGLGVGVTMVVTRSNFRHLHEIIRLSHHLGADAVHLALAVPRRSQGRATPAAPPVVLLRPYWARALATAAALGMSCVAAGADSARHGARATAAKDRFAGIGVVDAAAGS